MIGYISDYNERSGTLTIEVRNYFDTEFLLNKASNECEVLLQDGRSISPSQNRAIHAMIRDITTYISGFAEKETVRNETLRMLQVAYMLDSEDDDEVRYVLTNKFCELQSIEMFSLSTKNINCASMTLAKDFLSWLIDFAIENGIPCSSRLIDRAEDVGRYLYSCLSNKTCCICGKTNSDLHHVDKVGMGRNRREINHVGERAECLCRDHHTESHTIGQKTFDEKYKVFGIPIDETLSIKLGLQKEKNNGHITIKK